MTGREMCELTAYVLSGTVKTVDVDPESIWEISRTGELWPVFELFQFAERELTAVGLGPRS